MLGEGFLTSLQIFAFTLIGALPLGVPVALLRVSRFKVVRGITRAYISVMRGTPLMLQMFAIYFMPYYVFGIQLTTDSKWQAAIVAFIINYAAYFAEIYRGGIESISAGQYEAAQVLGYRKGQTFFRIILPQMVKRVLPSVTNEVITLVKDTSLASVIGTVEMFTRAKQIAVAPNSPGMLAFAAAAVFYFVFNSLVAFAMERIEKAFAYYR